MRGANSGRSARCSGCDTLEGIRGYEDGTPTDEQANEYLTLALHIVQRLKVIGWNEPEAR